MALEAHIPEMARMNIRAVILDFGGVIAYFPTEEQLSSAAARCGLTRDEFVRAFWSKRQEYDRGEDPVTYWQQIAHMTGRTFDRATVDEMVQREIDFWSRFDDRVLAWTGDLRNAGIRTGILSNLPSPLGAALRARNGFLDHFDQVTFSYELRTIKPEPGIYKHAVDELGVAPAEALFLDDREENIEGARRAGLITELYKTWEDFIANDRERFGLPKPK